jgi:hypothetical protein
MERALKQYQTQVEEKTWGVESTDLKDIMSLNARMDKQEEVTNQKVTNQKNDDEVKAQQMPPEIIQSRSGRNRKSTKHHHG